MKTAIVILGLFIVSISAMAQDKSPVKQRDLKGPDYKNHKVWMHKIEPTNAQSATTAETLQGPDFKNRQPGREASNVEKTIVSTVGSEQQKLQGPAYKNFSYKTGRVK